MANSSKFLEHLDLIKVLYGESSKNVTQTSRKLSKILGEEYNDNFRRKLSSFISSKLDSTRKDDAIEKSKHFEDAKKRKVRKGSAFYLITWAQNQADVFEPFFQNLKAYADEIGAQLLIIAGRYRNPTSLFSNRDYDMWDSRISEYLVADRYHILDNLTILSDIKVSATSSIPLAQKELISGSNSCIIGHPRVHLKSVTRHPAYAPKVMWTTGAVTMPNYTDTNSGKVAYAHHTYGACIVEKDGTFFHCRQITADDDGSFYDLTYKVEKGVVSNNNRMSAVVLGDIHVRKSDEVLLEYIENKVLKKFNPLNTIVHDVADMESVRKHSMKDPISEYLAHKKGTVNIADEIKDVKEFCRKWLDYNLVIPSANHHDHLDQYVRSQDWRKDPVNGMTYTRYTQILMEEKAPKGLLAYELDEEFGNDVITLGRLDSFRVHEWELALHGDKGANGARGSNNTFKRLSTKLMKAHDHTLERIDGVLSCGTCTEYELGYNVGLTNWLKGMAVIYPNGKAQQLVWINNKFSNFLK